MNIRAILIALVALALIAVAYYIGLNHEVQQTNIEETGIGEKLFPALKTEDVGKIKLSKENSEVILAKDENDTWIVSTFYDYRANQSNVNRLLGSLSEIIKERKVSSKPKNFPVYEVSDENGVKVQLFDTFDKVLAELIVGKTVPDDFRSTYVRRPGSDSVLVGKSESNIITYALGLDYKTKKITDQNWVDKQITVFDPDNVRKVELITPQSTIVLEKLKEEIEAPSTPEDTAAITPREPQMEVKWIWVVTEPENFEPTEKSAQGLAQTLTRMYASDAAEKKNLSEYGLDNPDTRALFHVVKNKKELPETEIEFAEQPEQLQTIEILIGNCVEKNKFYCKRADRDEIYLIMKYAKESIFKKLEDFKPKPAREETAEPSQVPPSTVKPIIPEEK